MAELPILITLQFLPASGEQKAVVLLDAPFVVAVGSFFGVHRLQATASEHALLTWSIHARGRWQRIAVRVNQLRHPGQCAGRLGCCFLLARHPWRVRA